MFSVPMVKSPATLPTYPFSRAEPVGPYRVYHGLVLSSYMTTSTL